MQRRLAASLITLLLSGGAATEAAAVGPLPERPYRVGYIKMSPRLDREKPLAPFDPAGYALNSGLLIGAYDDRWISAMALASRQVQWWLDGGAQLTAPPGSFGGSVVLGFRDGKIMRVEALTGHKQWSITLDSFIERPFLLSGTTLYVMTAAQVLYALDFQSGKTLWLFDAGFPEGLAIRNGARPVVHENKVLFGTASGELLAVAADTGKLQWRYNPSYNEARFHDVVGDMVLRSNKLIFTRYDGYVAALDLNGSVRNVLWSDQLPSVTTSTLRGDRLYVGGLNGDVYAIDPDNGGKHLWRQTTGSAVSTLTAGESKLYVVGAGGRLSVLDNVTGAYHWVDNLGASSAAAPIFDDNLLYFSTGLKSLYAYKIK